MARNPTTTLRLSDRTLRTLRQCAALAWYTDDARSIDELLGPMLKNRYRTLRRRARDRGGDPDELLRLAETGSKAPADGSEPFEGLPVKSPRVDDL